MGSETPFTQGPILIPLVFLVSCLLGMALLTFLARRKIRKSPPPEAQATPTNEPIKRLSQYAQRKAAGAAFREKRDRRRENFQLAVERNQLVRIVYVDANGERTIRTIQPDYADQYAVGGWCQLRNDYRHFRYDRMDSVELL